MARRDEDGYYHLVDRKSNMIISGGENVYPSEVESLLGAHPEVKDVAVIGVPDDEVGRGGACASSCCTTARQATEREILGLVPRPDRRLQAAALGRVHRRRGDAAHRHRQDPASRAAGPRLSVHCLLGRDTLCA